MTVQLRPSKDVPGATSDSGPTLTVLSVLAAGWAWRTDPDDQQLPVTNADGPAGDEIDHQLVRAFLWAQILIG